MADDTIVIRPEMTETQVKPRGRDLDKEKRRALKKALQTLHSLEIMAVNIYKCQITTEATPLNTALTMAMSNEMTHMQDFQTRLYEYGFKPAKLRGRFWLAGYVFGLGSQDDGHRAGAEDRHVGREQGCGALRQAAGQR